MTYVLVNKRTNNPMRGSASSRQAARNKKRRQPNPMNWQIVRITADGGAIRVR